MDLHFCGGAKEVGASCILTKISNKNILLDCGMRMSKDPLPDLNFIKEFGGVDLIVISHAHMDHIGTLPIISTEYPNAKIIMTHMSKDLLKVLLYDSLKIMDMRESEIPIFSEIHVQNMINRIICYSPVYEIHPFNDNYDIKITMYSAGHIPGAAFIYIVSPEGSIFYSGDFSTFDQIAVNGAFVPKLRPDVGIFESTYGNRLHNNREIELNSLLNKIIEVVSSSNKILIPAFALGRAQEVILFLINSMQKGTCPKFKIYVDGMVNDICRVFRKNPNYLKERYAKRIYKGIDIFYNENVIPVPRNESARKEIISKEEGLCIISSSGMLTGGPSTFYAKYIAASENNFIALTGYQDEESPGAKLLALADDDDEDKSIQIGDETIPLKCGIGMYGLSAHADKSQILAAAHSLSPKKTFFVHGSPESCFEVSSAFQKEHFGETNVPENGDHFNFDFTNTKRKQLEKKSLKSLNKYFESIDDIGEDDIKELWEFLQNNYINTMGFTLEDLFFVLTGTDLRDDLMLFNKKIYDSEYFAFELKRPYIFHYVKPEDIKVKDEFMEVNKALTLAQETFEPYGLYKKGAKSEEKII
ncbi:MAG: MBL fold metallo-hydrolase, partial [Oscillospiraceae bacterium]|nr:MBL fold metallo-hydrolase [Oscillospiraceae bacterium]